MSATAGAQTGTAEAAAEFDAAVARLDPSARNGATIHVPGLDADPEAMKAAGVSSDTIEQIAADWIRAAMWKTLRELHPLAAQAGFEHFAASLLTRVEAMWAGDADPGVPARPSGGETD